MVHSGRAEEMARAQVGMWVYWFKGDRIAGAVDWVSRTRSSVHSASLEFLAGLFAFQTGDFPILSEVLPAALQGFREDDDTFGQALALTFGSLGADDPEQGYQLLDEALHLVGDSDPALRMIALLFQSMLDSQAGHLDEALRHREEVLLVAHRTELPELTAWAKWNLGWTYLAMGKEEKSAALWSEAFDHMAGARYQEGVASTADGIAMCELRAGRLERAATLLGAASATFERIGTVPWIEAGIVVEAALADLRRDLGDELFERNYGLGREFGFDQTIALTAEAIDDLSDV